MYSKKEKTETLIMGSSTKNSSANPGSTFCKSKAGRDRLPTSILPFGMGSKKGERRCAGCFVMHMKCDMHTCTKSNCVHRQRGSVVGHPNCVACASASSQEKHHAHASWLQWWMGRMDLNGACGVLRLECRFGVRAEVLHELGLQNL